MHSGRSQVLSESDSGATLQVTGLLVEDTSGAGTPLVLAGRAVETITFDGPTDVLTITRGRATTTLDEDAQFCAFAAPILG
jgi:hypothetical protein